MPGPDGSTTRCGSAVVKSSSARMIVSVRFSSASFSPTRANTRNGRPDDAARIVTEFPARGTEDDFGAAAWALRT